MKFVRNSYEFRTSFVRISVNFVQFAPFALALPRVHSPFLNLCLAHLPTCACRSHSPLGRQIFGTTPSASTSPGPDCPRSTPIPPKGPGDQPAGTGGGRAPSEAGSVRTEGSQRSRRSGGSEASTARGHMAREVVVPQPSRDELGDAHNDPPLRPGHPGRQAAGSGLDPAGAARAGWAAAAPQCRVGHGVGVVGGAGHPPHLLPLPHCAPGGGPTCLRGRSWWACLPTGL